MKKYAIFICLVFSILTTMAQDYLISFVGTGSITTIGTIKVDNLISGATVTLNGGDILHLVPAVGIESKNMENGALQISPNPMVESSILTFVSSENGNTDISIIDQNRKIISKISSFLSSGVHSFRLSGLGSGMYLVKVTEEHFTYSTKIVSQCNQTGEVKIEHISSTNNLQGNSLKSSTTTVEMPYNNGEQLLYTGISGFFSTIVPDIPIMNKTVTFYFTACTDANNNNYPIVQIGSQTWMAQNLNVGAKIPGSSNQTNNSIIEKYCYNDDDANCDVYGGLYQWDEAMQYSTLEGVKGICPVGWHLPTDAEWTTLTTFLYGELVAGGMMKETGLGHWASPNTGATNSSGFTALPGGNKSNNGSFNDLTISATFWSSSQEDATLVWRQVLFCDDGYLSRGPYYKTNGFSGRCVQD